MCRVLVHVAYLCGHECGREVSIACEVLSSTSHEMKVGQLDPCEADVECRLDTYSPCCQACSERVISQLHERYAELEHAAVEKAAHFGCSSEQDLRHAREALEKELRTDIETWKPLVMVLTSQKYLVLFALFALADLANDRYTSGSEARNSIRLRHRFKT